MVDAVMFWGFTTVYMIITLALAWIGHKKTKKGEDFLVGGRNVHPIIIGLSYGSTFISTSAIVGFGGVAAKLGMGLIWLTFLNIFLGIFIAFLVFGKKTRELAHMFKAYTFPGLIGKRFESPFLHVATAFLILVSMPLYSSAVLIGGSRFIEETLGVQYEWALIGFAIITATYVVFGGLLAVMYTDAFQGAIMIFGMSTILILTYASLGGVDHANLSLANMNNLVPAGLSGAGMNGWTSMPDIGSSIWYTMVTTIIMGVGIGVLAQPQLIVRFMTAKDSKALHRAVPIGGFFILMMTGVAFTIGALTNVYFYEHGGKIAIASVANGNVDLIIPAYINAAMPDWVVVLFMLTLLAAAMSTLSSLFHTMGSAAGTDLWHHAKKRVMKVKEAEGAEDNTPSLRANQLATAFMIFASLGLAFIMPGSIIARATAMFMGLCAAAFLPMFAYGLFVKDPKKIAAELSLAVGAITWFLWTVFVHSAESQPLGICKWFFGVDTLMGQPWPVIDALVIALPASIITLLVVWWIAARKDRAPA